MLNNVCSFYIILYSVFSTMTTFDNDNTTYFFMQCSMLSITCSWCYIHFFFCNNYHHTKCP